MSYNHDGLRHPAHIFEAALWGYSVRVDCGRCSHYAVFEQQSLWYLFEKRGWDDSKWNALGRFFCTRCAAKLRGRVRPNRLTFAHDRPTIQVGKMPDEQTARQAAKRFRY